MQNTYSQSNEDVFVLNYFGNYTGNLLEIGANDGITFSNSRLLIENGWSADLVEPGDIYDDLSVLYRDGLDDNVDLYKLAIGDKNDTVSFFNSGAHVSGGSDKGLVSSIDLSETKRWPNVKFVEKKVQMVTWKEFYCNWLNSRFLDFISIDAEGYDWKILQQIDLESVGCQCLCIEWNGDNELLNLFTDYCKNYKLAMKNAENLIFVK